MIEVRQTGNSDPLTFDVLVRETENVTRHWVTMSKADHDRLAKGSCPPQQCVEATFRFLLDREPKEAILSHFDISVISRYFPNFETMLTRYIGSGSAAGCGS